MLYSQPPHFVQCIHHMVYMITYWSWKSCKHVVNMARLPYSHVKMPKLLVELQPIPCQWLALSLLIISSQANYAYGIMCLLAMNMHVWLQYIYLRAGQNRRGGGWEGRSSSTNAVAGSPPTHTPWNSAHTLEPLCEEKGDFSPPIQLVISIQRAKKRREGEEGGGNASFRQGRERGTDAPREHSPCASPALPSTPGALPCKRVPRAGAAACRPSPPGMLSGPQPQRPRWGRRSRTSSQAPGRGSSRGGG